MDINLVEWHPYTEENWGDEIEYIEWHSAQDGNFAKVDIYMIARTIILVYARLLAYACNMSVDEAINVVHNRNFKNFEDKLYEIFEPIPWGEGISYSGLKKILSSIYVPKL